MTYQIATAESHISSSAEVKNLNDIDKRHEILIQAVNECVGVVQEPEIGVCSFVPSSNQLATEKLSTK